jgi:hypothetical protein
MEVSTSTTTNPVNMYNFLNNLALNPVIVVIIVVIIVAYAIFFSSLGKNAEISSSSSSSSSSSTSENSQKILGIIVIIILVILIIINALQYFFSIDITAYINNLFTPTPQVDIVVNQDTYQPTTVPEIKMLKQVFNVPGNYYNYKDANAICSAYGSELATYQQVESSYNSGAEWCNYGWSANQLALFPTQQQTYNELQTIKGHENDCGRPGINGGYIANPNVRFGVNCYGYKPDINSEEEELMKNTTPYPETQEEIDMQKRVDYWKNKVDDILVSPFNYNTWSEL